MEAKKGGFDSLPKEILQQIFSNLDPDAKCNARATNRLFRSLLACSNFIAPDNADLTDICNHLLKYYSTTLIGLQARHDDESRYNDIVDNISKLTNLSSLQSVQFQSDDQWFKLTDLTNLYKYREAGHAPSSVVSHWSKLTRIICAFGPLHKPDFPFSKLKALRKLALGWPDVDLTQNTNLTSLRMRSICSLASVSCLVKLRKLMLDWSSKESLFFSALTDLEYLDINTSRAIECKVDSHFLHLINSSRLTSLYINAYQQLYYGDLSRLTSLRELTILEYEAMESSGRINMALLLNLTMLQVQTINIRDFEEVTKLTNLKYLRMELPSRSGTILNMSSSVNATFSALTKLDTLNLLAIHVPSIENDLCGMKNLTDLIVKLNDNSDYKFFETAPIKLFHNLSHIESSQFWSMLTKCTTLESLIHFCDAPEDSVIWSLTSLSYLTQLSIKYTGRINVQYFTLLTHLRVLELSPLLGGIPIEPDWLKNHMTWLKDFYF